MAYTIKNNISFDEYSAIIDKVIESCFVDEVYSPDKYELSLRVFLIKIFVPDFSLDGCENSDTLWERVFSEEAEGIIEIIEKNKYYSKITTAIDNGINHRLRAIEASPMSLSDIGLSKLFGVIADKIDDIDTSDVFNKSTIESLITANEQSGKENFVDKLVDTMVEKGLVSKPNRATRRSNSKKNKSDTNTKIVKIDNTSKEVQDESK